ncbi:MAG: ATP phosphoribosyltransferase regulatory subunit [Nitrospinae bacterium]|nr:ATP phosphoribosyltransferase regulatory subunit [Nitrospinota bacterium]
MEIPRGLRTYIYDQSARKRWVEERLLKVFFRWGFQEIVTPAFEYLDTFSEGGNGVSTDRVFKFTERGTGKLLALRPDITPQIARTAATLLKDSPKPLRLCYCGNVFRSADPGSGEGQELYQGGIELIGLDSPEADAETIAIAVECMKELGLDGFKVAIGHMEFIKGILSDARLNEGLQEEIKLKIQKKDASGLDDVLSRCPIKNEKKDGIRKILNLFGGKEVIDKAREIADNPVSLRAIDNLRKVYQMLTVYGVDDSVLIDLGEVRGFGYYTGLIFEGFIKGLGSEICGGGRYDNLLERYGAKIPATGFAVDINRIIDVLEKEKKGKSDFMIDYIVIDFRDDKKIAQEISHRLRERGYKVARDIIKRELLDSLKYAENMNIENAIIMGTGDIKEGEAVIRKISTGVEKKLRIEDL